MGSGIEGLYGPPAHGVIGVTQGLSRCTCWLNASCPVYWSLLLL